MSLSARIAARGSDISLDARLLDLGLDGALVVLPLPVERGDRVVLSIDLPGLWDPLMLEAVVTWTVIATPEVGAKVGIQFVEPSGRSLRLIGELVAQR